MSAAPVFKIWLNGMASNSKIWNRATKIPNIKLVKETVQHNFNVGSILKLVIFWPKSNEGENCFWFIFGVFERLKGKIGKSAK